MARFGMGFAGSRGPRSLQVDSIASTGGVLVTAGLAYAQFVGRPNGPLSSIDVHAYVSGAVAVAGGGGASLNWAELAIAMSTASDILAANVALTLLAQASLDAEVRAGATVMYRKTLTGLFIPADADLWVVFASSYQTTQATMRIASEGDVQGYARTRIATQPSLNLNAPLTFAGTPGSGLVVPAMRASIR